MCYFAGTGAAEMLKIGVTSPAKVIYTLKLTGPRVLPIHLGLARRRAMAGALGHGRGPPQNRFPGVRAGCSGLESLRAANRQHVIRAANRQHVIREAIEPPVWLGGMLQTARHIQSSPMPTPKQKMEKHVL